MTIHRVLAIVGALALLAATPAFAQDVDQDMDDDGDQGGCVSNREVYASGAELCQAGTLMRCNAGAWDEIGACQAAPEPAPVSGGGDSVDSDD